MTDPDLDRLFHKPTDIPGTVSESIRAQILSRTFPVSPVMNGLSSGLLFAALIFTVSLAAAAVLGFSGWRVLPVYSGVALLGTLLGLAYWTGVMMARATRPGAGMVYSWLIAALGVASYEFLLLAFFKDYSRTHFVQRGLICFSVGLACGFLAMLPIWLIVRRGFIVQPVRTGALMGALGGLSGLIALTLHCNQRGVPHSAIWHAGVLIACVVAGGALLKAKPPANFRET